MTSSQKQVIFQLLSDLHLQSNQPLYDYEITARAPYLLLPGDIGSVRTTGKFSQRNHQASYRAWLVRQCKLFQRVFLIAGNHEYKGRTIAYGTETLRNFAADPDMEGKLTYLEEDSYDLMDGDDVLVTILGCALWTRIRDDQRGALFFDMEAAGGIMGETIDTHNERFQHSFAWLKEEVARVRAIDRNRRLLVMTHHAPCIRGTSAGDRDSKGSQWSNYQNDILGGEGVDGLQDGDVWVYGHTHWPCNRRREDEVRMIANQRGRGEGGNLFNPEFVFHM